jgi:hypothetical protein
MDQQRFDPVLAEVAALPGHEGIALLIVATTAADAIKTEILTAHASLDHAEVHRLDGQFLEHPWAPANAIRPGSGRAPDDNQVRVR